MTDQCQYAKSDMTPCVLKDGDMSYAMNSRDYPICVGCNRTPAQLGLKHPANWTKEIAEYYAKRKTQMIFYHVVPSKMSRPLKSRIWSDSNLDNALGKAKDLLESGHSVEIKVVYEKSR